MTGSETGGDRHGKAKAEILARLQHLRIDETHRLARTLGADPLYSALSTGQCRELAEQLRTAGVAPPSCAMIRLTTAASLFRQRAHPSNTGSVPGPRTPRGHSTPLIPWGWSDIEEPEHSPKADSGGSEGMFLLSAAAAVGGR